MQRTQGHMTLIDRGKFYQKPISGYATQAWNSTMILHKYNSKWQITDKITGLQVVPGQKTRLDACIMLEDMISKVSVDTYNQYVEKQLKHINQ